MIGNLEIILKSPCITHVYYISSNTYNFIYGNNQFNNFFLYSDLLYAGLEESKESHDVIGQEEVIENIIAMERNINSDTLMLQVSIITQNHKSMVYNELLTWCHCSRNLS